VEEGKDERYNSLFNFNGLFSASIEWLLETIILDYNNMQKHFELLMLPQRQLFASLIAIYLHG
jgi:hypothetical protein